MEYHHLILDAAEGWRVSHGGLTDKSDLYSAVTVASYLNWVSNALNPPFRQDHSISGLPLLSPFKADCLQWG